jgi:hypothetical protein
MSTSTLYDSTRLALQQAVPDARASHLETLALVVASATQTQSAHLADLARALPLPTTQAAKEPRQALPPQRPHRRGRHHSSAGRSGARPRAAA